VLIFIKLLYSEVKASFAYCDNPLEHFHMMSWSHEEVRMILLVHRLIPESVLQPTTCYMLDVNTLAA